MKIFFVLIVVPILQSSTTNARVLPENDSVQISLLLDPEQGLNITDDDKPILRYGFQKTQECNIFEKAFLCIRKCMDLGFQIAHSDKKCHCTCKHNREIAKYKKQKAVPTKWTVGTPTTRLPSWILKHTTKSSAKYLKDYEIYGDVPVSGEAPAKNMNGELATKDQKNEEFNKQIEGETNLTEPNELNNEADTDGNVEANATNDTSDLKEEEVAEEKKEGVTEEGQEGVTGEVNDEITEEGKEGVIDEGEEGITGDGQVGVTEEGQEGVTGEGEEGVTKEGDEEVTGEGADGVTGEGNEGVATEEGVTEEGNEGVITEEGEEETVTETAEEK